MSEEHIKKQNESASKTDDVEIDLSGAKSFFSNIFSTAKNKSWVVPLVFILIIIFISVYFRMQPLYLPVTDQWAQNAVNNYYSSQVRSQIDQNFPDLDSQTKNSLAQKSFDQYKVEHKAEIDEQVKQASQQYKELYQRDDNGIVYVFNLDSYAFINQVENYIKYGHTGTYLKNGVPYFYRRAPLGYQASPFTMHNWALYAIYLGFNIFSKTDIYVSSLYLNIILMIFAVIPAFFIAKKLSNSNVGGFFGALLISVHQGIMSRTSGADADNDVYNILFPLYIIWLFILTLDAKELKKKIEYTIITAILLGFYSMSWGGWWYIFDMLLLTQICVIIIEVIKQYKFSHHDEKPTFSKMFDSIKTDIYSLFILFFLTWLVSGILNVTRGGKLTDSLKSIFVTILGPFNFLQLKAVGITTEWPNIYTTVAELNPSSLNEIINSIGSSYFTGVVFLLLGATALAILLYRDINSFMTKEGELKHYKFTILFALWVIVTLYPAITAVRFLLIVTPPLVLSLSIFFGIIDDWLSRLDYTSNKKLGIRIGFLVIAYLVISPLVQTGFAVSQQQLPLMNDMWFHSLDYVEKNTPNNSIMTSWWDFGYFFEAVAKRPTTFDGGFQDSHDAHWVGKSFLTNDERTSVGILRMLDCGQNTAFEVLYNYTNDTKQSIDVLNKLFVMNKDSAKEYLIKNKSELKLDDAGIDNVLKYSHCEAPTGIYITSGDMIKKAGVWAHFGSWNFTKSHMFKLTNGKSKDESISILSHEFGISIEDANSLYNEMKQQGGDNFIAPWPSYVSDDVGCADKQSNLECNIPLPNSQVAQFKVNKNNFDAYINTPDGKKYYPLTVVYMKDGSINKKEFNSLMLDKNSTIIPDFNLIVFPNKERTQYSAILSSKELSDSIFTKLFFFEGQGMKCFKKLYEESHPIGNDKVIVWQVDWDCNQNIKYYDPIISVKAEHILISTQNRTDTDAEKQMKHVLLQINSTNFEEIAKKYSDDPSVKFNNGDLGYFKKGQMVPEFEKVAFNLTVGQVGIAKTKFGYHILKILDRKEE